MMSKRFITVFFYSLGLFSLGVLLPVAVVYAQETLTPTVTAPAGVGLTPVYNPTEPTDFTCPQGDPSGWGEVTPNPYWLYQCGDCVGDELGALSTITPNPATVTAIATSGTPVPTSTPDPSTSCSGVAFPTPNLSTPQPVQVFDDLDARITYAGSCALVNNSHNDHYLDWAQYTTVEGCTADFDYTGVEFRMTARKYTSRGTLDIYIDGQFIANWSQYSGSVSYAPSPWFYPTTGYGEHHVQLVAHSNGTQLVFFDKFEYQGDPPQEFIIVANAIWDSGHVAGLFNQRTYWCEEFGTGGLHCYYEYIGNEGDNLNDAGVAIYLDPNFEGISNTQTVYVRHVGGAEGLLTYAGALAFGGGGVRMYDWDIDTTAQIDPDVGTVQIISANHHDPEHCNCNIVTITGDLWLSPVPFVCDPAAAGEGGSGGAGYCGTVEGNDSINDFGYSGVTFGGLACVDVGGWQYEILGLTIAVPHVAHICFQNVGLGTLTIFGLALPLDPAVIVFAAAWALRSLWNS